MYTLITHHNLTPFQRRVYLALLQVPMGSTISYKQLGKLISCRSAQAIGQALRRNPFAVGSSILPEYRQYITTPLDTFTPEFCVPCHRVIASSGHLGGFCGETQGPQLERKRQILEYEKKVCGKE